MEETTEAENSPKVAAKAQTKESLKTKKFGDEQ
jgi:hypothetical protein